MVALALWGPGTSIADQGSSSRVDATMNHVLDEFYVIFTAPKSGVLDQIDLYVSLQSGGGRTLSVGISELDAATNLPTGVAAGGSAYASLAIASTGLKQISLTSPATVVAGVGYAVHVRDGGGIGGTVDFRETDDIDSEQERFGQVVGRFNDGSTRSISNGALPAYSARYTDGEYIATIISTRITVTAYTAASTPDEIGNLFTVPVDMTIAGMMMVFNMSAGATGIFTLYDAADVVLGSATYEAGMTTNRKWFTAYFTAPVALTAGVNYRMTWTPTAGTHSIWQIQFEASAHRTSTGLVEGNRWQRTQRTNAGAWTEVATQIIDAMLIVETLDIVVAPSCSAVAVSYSPWTRTGPLNTPWSLSFLAADGDNAAAAYEVWTGAGRTGTQVASGACTSASPVTAAIAYDATGLVDGNQTLYLSIEDGVGNVGDDCTFTLRRDDIAPTAVTGITAVPA